MDDGVKIVSKWKFSNFVADEQWCSNLFSTKSFNRTFNEKQNLLTLRSCLFIPSVYPLNWIQRNSEMTRGQWERTVEVTKQLINLALNKLLRIHWSWACPRARVEGKEGRKRERGKDECKIHIEHLLPFHSHVLGVHYNCPKPSFLGSAG